MYSTSETTLPDIDEKITGDSWNTFPGIRAFLNLGEFLTEI